MKSGHPTSSPALLLVLASVAVACDAEDAATSERGSPSEVSETAQRPARAIESPIGDFVVEVPAGFGEPLWKAKGPKDMNFAAASGPRTVEVRSSPNDTQGSKILDTATLFRMACGAVEADKSLIVDSARDHEVDGQLARTYRTHPADPNKSGAVQMMFVASDERFYAVSMAAPTAADFDDPASKGFFDSFHVKSLALRAHDAGPP